MIDRDTLAALAAEVARLDVAGLAAALVRIPSHPGIDRQEEAAARALAEWLERHGLAARLDEAAPGRPNVVATVEGRRAGRHLLLCGHTDTVPLNAGEPGFGFAGEVVDGALRGRGSVDMKGPLAAMAVAAVALARTPEFAGRLTLAAVVDEEMESLGAEKLVRDGFAADGAIVGEPTMNRVALGHKGLEWLAVELVGRAAHGGTPQAGVNAISAAAQFVGLVERRLVPRLGLRAHPLLGPPTLNFGRIQGGDQPSTVAALCHLALDRRSVPGETYETILAELEEVATEVRSQRPGLATRIDRVPGGMATLEHVGFVTAADHPLAAAAFAARGAVVGDPGPGVAFPAWTDGALLSHFAGIPTIVLGPGDLSLAHGPRESVPVADLEQAARIYAAAALAFGHPASAS
ncbi:MAG: M20/M25/M40 family metallo-hydrolase [Thermoanaerobaculia bacterium]